MSFSRPVSLVVAFGLFTVSSLSGGVVLTIDNSAIAGTRLDTFTLPGSLVSSAITVSLIPGRPPWSLSSRALAVLGILTPSGLLRPDGGSYAGPLPQVQIAGGTWDGSYSDNPFSISFGDDSGRTFYTNGVSLTAD